MHSRPVSVCVRACMHVCSLCEVPCAFTCVWKWHMLAVGGSAGKASWLAGGEPESQHSGKKNPVLLMLRVEVADVHHLKNFSCPLMTAGTFSFFSASLTSC